MNPHRSIPEKKKQFYAHKLLRKTYNMKLGEMDGESAFAFESQRMLLYDGKNRVKKCIL